MNSNPKRLYRIVDYPNKGTESGMFYSASPGRAAQKIINRFNISDESKYNMTKFWIREYIPISQFLLNLLNYTQHKLKIYNKRKLNNIFTLLYYNLLTKNKLINKDNRHMFNNYNTFNNVINKNNNRSSLVKKLNNKQLNLLLSILLIEYYKRNQDKKTNIKKKLESNITEINNNKDINHNINYLVIMNRKKIKIPNIYKDLLSNYFINNIEYSNNKQINDNTITKLKINLNKLYKPI